MNVLSSLYPLCIFFHEHSLPHFCVLSGGHWHVGISPTPLQYLQFLQGHSLSAENTRCKSYYQDVAKLLLQRIHWYECIKLALLARCTPDGTDIPINKLLVILLTHRPHTHYYYKWMRHNIVIKINVYTTHTLTLLQYILPHNRQYSNGKLLPRYM